MSMTERKLTPAKHVLSLVEKRRKVRSLVFLSIAPSWQIIRFLFLVLAVRFFLDDQAAQTRAEIIYEHDQGDQD